jgi:hypothetical protein
MKLSPEPCGAESYGALSSAMIAAAYEKQDRA